jgi:diguanylate cyclase (GGDEF)-like protein
VSADVRECRPGLVELVHRPVDGFPGGAHLCDGTLGLLEQGVTALALPGARIEHEICAAFGAPECRYHVVWRDPFALDDPAAAPTADRVRAELAATRERLDGMFDTTADLVGADLADEPLARIASRAAQEVGAARHLLAVRIGEGREPALHGHGFAPRQIQRFLGALRSGTRPALKPSWLAAPIRSGETDHGFLVVEPAVPDRSRSGDRELLEVYARCAAIALDSATVRLRAEHRFEQTTALLEFAREVSAAGTSEEVAQRIADSVGLVIDCDEVGVHLWDGHRFAMIGYRDHRGLREPLPEVPQWWEPEPDEAAARLARDPRLAPVFLSLATDALADRVNLARDRFEAAIVVPLAPSGRLLGTLFLGVRDRPERLRRTAELSAQLEGLVEHAATTLENGRLMDVVVHQARHDQLTGLPNRVQFADDLQTAIGRARSADALVGVFYLDLDRFKPVNDGFGHDAGDGLLVAVAGRLAAHAPDGTWVARLGGDEFSLIANARSADELDRLEHGIRGAFAEPFDVSGRDLELTVSVGRSVFPIDALDHEGLVRIADAAMYLDKQGQRARRPGGSAGG